MNLGLLAGSGEERRHKAALGPGELGPQIVGLGENTLSLLLPAQNAPLLLGLLPEDQPEEHVDASEGEQEESSDEGKVVDVVGEYGGGDEALEDTEGSQAKVGAQHREETIEEGDRPANFGSDEGDDLEDDEETVHDSPEHACGLVRYGAVFNVITVQ